MGIRFNCPSCGNHLNIKAFLAGKRGVCPACNTKFEIPPQSGGTARIVNADESDEAPRPPVAAPQPNRPTVATPQPAAAQPVPAYPTQAMAAPAPVRPMGAVQASPMATPGGMPAAAAMAGAPAVQAFSAYPAQPLAAAHGTLDPISEAPQASWYVRPPAGGQYGPALGNVMREWIQQRRVTPDSLVWREGWPDWKRADAVFPSMAAAVPIQAAAAYPAALPAQAAPVAVPAAPLAGPFSGHAASPGGMDLGFPDPAVSPTSTSRGVYRRRGGGQGRVVAITLLILLVAILTPVLIYVLMRNT
jgi:hypothetical protein